MPCTDCVTNSLDPLWPVMGIVKHVTAVTSDDRLWPVGAFHDDASLCPSMAGIGMEQTESV